MTAFLIIDDSPEDREHFEFLLTETQPEAECVLCHGQDEALEAMQLVGFDCVLLDLRLDGEDGLDVMASLHERQPNLPVIVFSGQGSEQAATNAFVAGAAYYLPKDGLTSITLSTAIKRVMQKAATEQELEVKRVAMERSSRMEAVGQLAAGIAHDFNNQLATLRYCIELLKPSATTPQAQGHVATAVKVIDQSSHLAGRLLSLSRQGDVMAKPVPLRAALNDLKTLASVSLSEDVTLRLGTVDPLLTAYCDPGQLFNALLNLVLNANDAMASTGQSGTVHVWVRDFPEEVRITVSDTGKGMSEDVLALCADPFYTTKRDQNGTGLGLAMVQGFANDNNGALLLKSEEGVGTEATLVLPAAPLGAEAEAPTPKIERPRDQSARVLLVEDQLFLSMVTKDILEAEGHAVEMVRDAPAALDLLAAGYTADLVITDIRMPGMSGLELAKRLVEMHKNIGIIYVTGYTDDQVSNGQSLHGPILQKPVEPRLLLDAVNKVLTGLLTSVAS